MILRNEAKGIKQEGKKLLEPSRINAAFKDLSPCSGKLYLPWCWWFRRSVEFASLQCHGLQLTRLLCPWDFPARILELVVIPFFRVYLPWESEWVKSLSHVQLFVTPWTVAYQAPPSMDWSGLPSPSPGDLPNPGIEPRSPALQAML